MSKTFTVEAVIKIQTNKNIVAESFEDAIEKSKKMCYKDFISIKGDHNDSNVKIVGVCTYDDWDLDEDE